MTPKTPDDDALGARPRSVVDPGVALTAPIVPKTIEVIDNEYEVDGAPSRAQLRALAERGVQPPDAGAASSETKPAHDRALPDTAAREGAARDAPAPKSAARDAASAGTGPACASCGLQLDADARFCKRCDTRAPAPDETPATRS